MKVNSHLEVCYKVLYNMKEVKHMSKITEALKEKFAEYQIPVDIANSFLAKYHMFERGLLPEFELCDIPTDDCFKTLQTYCSCVKDETPDDLIVHKLLQIPFSQIQATKDKLIEFVDASVIEEGYLKTEMYFVEPEFIDQLKAFLESKNIQEIDYSKWFVEALILGEDAIGRVNGIFELLDEHTAKTIVSEAAIWYPYSDMIGLIHYLLEQGLTNTQICKLLLEDPILKMHYREEGCRTIRYGHDQGYVDYAISRIKSGE